MYLCGFKKIFKCDQFYYIDMRRSQYTLMRRKSEMLTIAYTASSGSLQ